MEQDNRNEQVATPEEEVEEVVDNASETVSVEDDGRSREELLADLAKLTAEAEDYKVRYLRAQADFDNFRRRARQEKEEFAAYANTKIIEELLPVLDTFEMALKTSEDTDTKTLLVGVEMVHRQLVTALGNYGLAAIESVGQPFDPNLHEGVMQVETDGHDANTVVEEMRKGYKLKDKVIRPSMVKVSQ
ncbi:MAG TPA: nucleotide exchange factor GrpE [Bacilli bacterium]|nr:nucleotide exchange factor GrpE [Bacilli bacterium]